MRSSGRSDPEPPSSESVLLLILFIPTEVTSQHETNILVSLKNYILGIMKESELIILSALVSLTNKGK